MKKVASIKPKSKSRGASSQVAASRSFAWQKMLPVLGLLCLLLIAVAVYQAASVITSQPVARVVVNGDFRQVDQRAIVDQVQPFLTEGFVLLDLEGIRQQLLQQPWIFDVSVSRRWPDQIVIAVVEQMPIANWGESAYLNHRGELFKPAAGRVVSDNLPRLAGPDNRAAEVMDHFRELGEVLSQESLTLEQLVLNERGSWSAKLDSGVAIVLGTGETMEKVRRLLLAYRQGLSADFSSIKTVDMRYNNGFAVAWKDAESRG